jgi:hypothetical protein
MPARLALPEVVRVPAFRALLVARTISSLGSWMQDVAVAFLVIDETGSVAALGVAVLARQAPALALAG